MLVELLVVRLGDLGYGADDAPGPTDERTVQDSTVIQPPGRPDDEHPVIADSGQSRQGDAGFAAQVVVEEEVFAAIARHREFREEHDRRIGRGRLVRLPDEPGVGARVGDDDRRSHGSDFQEAEVGKVHRAQSEEPSVILSTRSEPVIGIGRRTVTS